MKFFYTALRTTHTALTVVLLGILLLASGAGFGQDAMVTTDKQDYLPGETVIITGSGWTPDEMVNMVIEHLIFDHPDDTLSAVADGNGNIYSNEYVITIVELGETFELTATGVISGQTAIAIFTDGAPDIEAWHNLPTAQWSGGTTVQQANSLYSEGDLLPFQYTHATGNPAPILLNGQTYVITLRWDFAAFPEIDKYFIDYLGSYDGTITGVTPFDDFPITGNTEFASIPNDPDFDGAVLPDVISLTRQFFLYNIDPTSLVYGIDAGDVLAAGETEKWPYVIEAESGGKITKRLRIQFTVNGPGALNDPTSVGIAFGGHLADESFHGIGNGAANFPGASPQFRINFDDATSDENININPSAIVPKPRIIVIKDTDPNNEQDFTFTLQQVDPDNGDAPIGDLINFDLDDDSDGTLPNSETFLTLEPGVYTVAETPATAWQLSSITATGKTIEAGTPFDPIYTIINGNTTIRINVDLDQEVTITFLNIPAPCDLNINAPDVSICYNETADLSASATGGSGDYTYEWYLGDISDFTGQTPVGTGQSYTTPVLTSTASYTIRVIDNIYLSCEERKLVTAGVNDALSVLASDDVSVCYEANTVTLTALASGGTPTYTYEWFESDDLNTSIGSGASLQVSPAATTAYTVVATDAFSATTGECTASDEVVVTVNDAFTVELDDLTVCEYEDVIFTADASGGTENYTYEWTVDGVDASTLGSDVASINAAGDQLTLFEVLANAAISVTVNDDFVPTQGDDPCTASNGASLTVKPCSYISLIKLTNGVVNPDQTWNFNLYEGTHEGALIASDNTSGDIDGILFDEYGPSPLLGPLSRQKTYTLCEMGVPAGYGTFWFIDPALGEDPYTPDRNFTPIPYSFYGAGVVYNPDQQDNPPQDLGNRCYNIAVEQLLANTYGDIDPDTLWFEINNTFPGGDPRTPGYWKNWNTCTGGGQQYTANTNSTDIDNSGGKIDGYDRIHSGWALMDDLIGGIKLGNLVIVDDPDYGSNPDALSACQKGQLILDNRDLDGENRSSDPAYNLAKHLLAYQLNQGAGAYICDTLAGIESSAVDLLIDIGFDGHDDYLKKTNNPSSRELASLALELAGYLDRYNNSSSDDDFCDELKAELAGSTPPDEPSGELVLVFPPDKEVRCNKNAQKAYDAWLASAYTEGCYVNVTNDAGPTPTAPSCDDFITVTFTVDVDCDGNPLENPLTESSTFRVSNTKSAEIVTAVEPEIETGKLQVYPNPYTEKVNFVFTPEKTSDAVLEIYNVTGQKIATLLDKQIEGGVVNRIEYNPTSESSGFYIYKLKLNGNMQVGRIIYKKE